jgi:hypothetical protein
MLPPSQVAAPFLVSLLLLQACGGAVALSAAESDGGGPDARGGADAGAHDAAAHDAAPRDASADSIPPADGPVPCGSTTCDPAAFCVHPCCGGAVPPCMPADDAGACPPGTHRGCFPDGDPSQCQQDPCTPAPPFCSPNASCDPGAGPETFVQGHDVSCVCS